MMRKAEFTFRDLTVRYLYDVPAQADAYLPMILYIPDSSLDHGYEKFISAEFQRNHPCSVIVPEVMDWVCPAVAQTIQRLIFDFRIKYKLDICRTYLVGAGYGAIGAWHLAGSYPRLFAAMVAIGGCADPYHIRNAKYMPIWAFHAANDPKIHVSEATQLGGRKYLAGSRRLVDALRTEGSELVRYTEYTSGAEELAERVMQSTEPWDWLFEQDRKKVIWITFIRPGLYRLDDWFMASAYLIEGEKKALLIDTTMTHAHVDEVVKRITRLPVELAITHPHRDHMLHAFEFEKVYIHEDDRKAMYDCIHGMYDMKAGKVPQRPQTNTYPEYMDQLDHFHQVVGLKDGDVIDLGGTTIEMMYLGGHTQHDVVFADHTHRCLFTGDAVRSGYVVGVRYEKNRFHETYAWYRDNLERFIGRMKGKEDYTCFGGHFIQENSCMDEMQEDYLNNQSEYFVPLSWKVIEDMYVLAGELADGMHDKEAHLDTGEEFFARHGSAMLAGSRLP